MELNEGLDLEMLDNMYISEQGRSKEFKYTMETEHVFI